MRKVLEQPRNLFLYRFIITVLCVGLILGLSGCRLKTVFSGDDDGDDKKDAETTEKTSSETVEETTTVKLTETTESVPEVTTTAAPAPTFANPASMYSSYAHMVSFDPATGWAEFDYFDILKGQDAIDWLVAEEGYTLAEAEEEVNNYADGEYVYKNVNPQLRTADMDAVSITMMYDAGGTQVDGAETVALTYSQFLALYTAHPNLVVDGAFFFHVTVSGGVITEVDQVYWC